MARFSCAACGQEGDFTFDPTRHECPLCGSNDVVFALGIDEMPDELFEALMHAEPLDDDPDEDR